MNRPNTLESVQPFSGQYSFKSDLKLSAWFLVAMATWVPTLIWKRDIIGLSLGWRLAIFMLPLVPGALGIMSYVRFARGMDELQRRIQSECWLIAALGTVIVGAVFSVLNENGIAPLKLGHGLGLGGSMSCLLVLWIAASIFTSRRYK